MKQLYLDDERPTPEGWDRCFTAWECIEKLKVGGYDLVSLDHDLGLGYYDHDKGRRIDPGNGYDVLLWIEKQVFTDPNFNPPKYIILHTANASAKEKMRLARFNIGRELRKREESKTQEGKANADSSGGEASQSPQ